MNWLWYVNFAAASGLLGQAMKSLAGAFTGQIELPCPTKSEPCSPLCSCPIRAEMEELQMTTEGQLEIKYVVSCHLYKPANIENTACA